MWVPFFHRTSTTETLGYHYGDFFSAGGVVQEGMVTVHPVGLPHGPKPPSLEGFLDGRRPERFDEVGIMADLANPAGISDFALGLSRPTTWPPGVATTPSRASRIETTASRRCARRRGLAGARDELRPRPDTP